MAYISEVPSDLVTLVGDAYVLNINQNHLINELYSPASEITGDIGATNEGGDGAIAEPGETLTVPTGPGSEVAGEYVGPVTFSSTNVTAGLPGLAAINLQVNSIEGQVMRADDGSVYVITDQPIDDDHLNVTASIVVAGRTVTVTAPISGITDALAAELDSIAADLGTLAGAPFALAADIVLAGADTVQTVLDTVVINTAEGSGVLAVVCFVRGTLILTDRGDVAIENLRVGDKVQTRDNGLQEIRWIGSKKFNWLSLFGHPNLLPIRIRTGALGNNVPSADLLVSQQHRILVRSKIAYRLFGTDEVLVPAKQLLGVGGIDVEFDAQSVEYFHILFDRHEVVYSNGAETESLFTGPEAIKAVGKEGRDEILAIFPELLDEDYVATAIRDIPSGRLARKMVRRHIDNGKPLTTPKEDLITA